MPFVGNAVAVGARRRRVFALPTASLLFDWDSTVGVTTDTGGVDSWTDQVSSVAATQATSGNRPDVVAGGVDFLLANSDHLDASTATDSSTTYTVYARIDLTSTDPFQVLLSANTGAGNIAFAPVANATGPGIYDGAWRNAGAGTAVTGDQVLAWVLTDGGSSQGESFRNGASVGSTYAYAGAKNLGGTMALGEHVPFAANYLNASVRRLLVYNVAHSSGTVSSVSSLLADL